VIALCTCRVDYFFNDGFLGIPIEQSRYRLGVPPELFVMAVHLPYAMNNLGTVFSEARQLDSAMVFIDDTRQWRIATNQHRDAKFQTVIQAVGRAQVIVHILVRVKNKRISGF